MLLYLENQFAVKLTNVAVRMVNDLTLFPANSAAGEYNIPEVHNFLLLVRSPVAMMGGHDHPLAIRRTAEYIKLAKTDGHVAP